MNTPHYPVDIWLRNARSQATHEAAQQHLEHCESCRMHINNIDRVRTLFPDPDNTVLDAKAKALTFQLEREARLARDVGQYQVQRQKVRQKTVLIFGGLGLPAAITLILVLLSTIRDELHNTGAAPKSFMRAAPITIPTSINHVNVQRGQLVHSPVANGQMQNMNPKLREPLYACSAKSILSEIDVPKKESASRPHSLVTEEASVVDGVDKAFANAWKLYRTGHADVAARAFDELLGHKLGSRRADVLFWSARAHQNVGDYTVARRRLSQLINTFPLARHAHDARFMLNQMGG